MAHLRLGPVQAPWGDYGDMLYHGMSMHLSRLDGKIRLERTGPEIFPITFPIDVIVIDEFRRDFVSSGLTGAEFVPVIKHRIVELDWSAWDVSDDEPPEYPDSGEPEDYILTRPHSPSTAAAMPNLWELVAGESPADIYYLPGTKILAVSRKARDWFERHYGDYTTVEEHLG